MSSVTNDPLARPDPMIGANWDDGHIPVPEEHVPELSLFEYIFTPKVEVREVDTDACLSVHPDGLVEVEEWR